MKNKFGLFIIFLAIGFANILHAQVLEKIETYKCAPYPVDKLHKALNLTKEAYDYRMEDGDSAKIPPTLTDVFICDIVLVMKTQLDTSIQPSEINDSLVSATFDIYLNTDWQKIRGLRPWTQWNFIRSLNKRKRKKLVSEVVYYIKHKGINHGKDI